MSEAQTALIKAFIAFQKDLTPVKMDMVNPHFKSKYASLTAIDEVVRPLLTKHGLSYSQRLNSKEDTYTINTILMHESGEVLESGELILSLDRTNMQGMGAACSYARRYQLSALLGVVSDEDTDGNQDKTPKKEETKPVTSAVVKPVEQVTSKSKNVAKPLLELQNLVKKRQIDTGFVSEVMMAMFDKTNSGQLVSEEIQELTRLLSGDLADLESYILNLKQLKAQDAKRV